MKKLGHLARLLNPYRRLNPYGGTAVAWRHRRHHQKKLEDLLLQQNARPLTSITLVIMYVFGCFFAGALNFA